MSLARIHITGASGAGVTTLGRALASRLAFPHHDSDDYFWLPTNPPYRERRPRADRLRLAQEMFVDRGDWVLTGSLDGWGDPLMPLFDLVVYLHTSTEVRLARLRERETRHFGTDACGPGGWRHAETEEFIDWAAHYEDGTREGRSQAKHEAWLARLTCPVLRLDGTEPTVSLVDAVIAQLADRL
jgi:adenylate kinase family enzyme